MSDWDEDDELYDENGRLTRYGLAAWIDNEGGLVDLVYYHGVDNAELPEMPLHIRDAWDAFVAFQPTYELLQNYFSYDYVE